MCCFYTILLFLGPRFASVIWWIFDPDRWVSATGAFDSAIWPILGILFLPWTTLMYLLVFPGGITGFDWFFMGIALLGDIGMYGGGGYGNRQRVGYGS